MERVERWTVPLNILFFVISGAELDLKILVNPVTLAVGAVYIAARSLGKYYGAYGSCRATKCSNAITKNLGITLLPQAGVALGMAENEKATATLSAAISFFVIKCRYPCPRCPCRTAFGLWGGWSVP